MLRRELHGNLSLPHGSPNLNRKYKLSVKVPGGTGNLIAQTQLEDEHIRAMTSMHVLHSLDSLHIYADPGSIYVAYFGQWRKLRDGKLLPPAGGRAPEF